MYPNIYINIIILNIFRKHLKNRKSRFIKYNNQLNIIELIISDILNQIY